MRNVREAITIIKSKQDIRQRKLKRISSESLAGLAGDGPFLPRSIFRSIKQDIAVDKVVVQTMEIVPQTQNHVPAQPGQLVGGWPVEESILIVLAKPFPKPIKASTGTGRRGAGGWPHFGKVERQKPNLGSMNSLFHFHVGILEKHLCVGSNITPLRNRLETHVQHTDAVHKSFNVAFSPLHARKLAESEQRGCIGGIVPDIVEFMSHNVVGKPRNWADVLVQVVWIECDTLKKNGHGFIQSCSDKGTRVIHDGEKVSGGDVPDGRMYSGSCARPWNVNFVLNTPRSS